MIEGVLATLRFIFFISRRSFIRILEENDHQFLADKLKAAKSSLKGAQTRQRQEQQSTDSEDNRRQTQAVPPVQTVCTLPRSVARTKVQRASMQT